MSLRCVRVRVCVFLPARVSMAEALCLKHKGPYRASGAIDLITGACVVANLQLAQSVLFPPAPRPEKLGNDLVPQGAARRKEEVCSGANVPWCYFDVSETTCATNQEIPGLGPYFNGLKSK